MKEVGRPLAQEHVAHHFPLADLGHDAEPFRDAAEPAFFLEEALGEGVVGQDESFTGR